MRKPQRLSVREERLGIKAMEKERRPRERLQREGAEALSDRELLAIIVGSGNGSNTVHTLAKKLLSCLDGSSSRTGGVDIHQLMAIPGIGQAKASLIGAALEFSRRRMLPSKKKVTSPEDIIPFILHLADRPQEQFIVLSLNGAHEVIEQRTISVGLVNRTLVHPREVFAGPLTDRAAAIICAHNHPSGNLEASSEDRELTQRIIEAGELLGIPLLDHVIFSYDDYYSFLENGDIDSA